MGSIGWRRSKNRVVVEALLPTLKDMPGKGWVHSTTPPARNVASFAQRSTQRWMAAEIVRAEAKAFADSWLATCSLSPKSPKLLMGDVFAVPNVVVSGASATAAFQVEMTGPSPQFRGEVVTRGVRQLKCEVGLVLTAMTAMGPVDAWTWEEIVRIAESTVRRIVRHPEYQPLPPIDPASFRA